MQVGQPQPGSRNRSQAPVENLKVVKRWLPWLRATQTGFYWFIDRLVV